MDLILPSSGLIIWQLIGFLALLFILMKFAWKPILESLEERESSIDDALKAAEQAKAEMANLKSENEKLLQEARIEKDNILKTANDTSAKMIEDAKQAAIVEGAKMIENAKAVIENEKKAALSEVKNQVAQLTLEVTDKLLRKNLSSQAAQQELVEGMVKDINLN
ncbi:ATP synthase F0 subcomplex B subunit [Belliella baltica DSM 15883]|uniref:ATP synthase subunit b n=1 Tax=Belliella baltica (strain DSM 15883 / CIP 108006 / LMG 21964 / BA134) TaxID=866536 RepID=I3Z242_BELBD|nr:F0F1 ATP synthase subunit B [Belliella baltica]AFL83310.1 ATP synthase F0 subcomplex B subunit [Belliella baltica DSM 15883]